jgi:hypothetical protein
MKFTFLLAPFAVAIALNACAEHHPAEPGSVHDDHGDRDEPGDAGGSASDGDSNAGSDTSDADSSVGGGASDGDNNVGGDTGDGNSSAGGAASDDGAGNAGGKTSDADSNAGGDASDGDGDAGTSGGTSSSGGSGGRSGLAGSGGSGSGSGNASSGGSASAGSDGGSDNAGSGGSASAGSDGVSDNVGSGGSASAGSAGASGSAGSGGVSGSAGSGGSSGSAGSGGSPDDGDEDVSLDPEYLFTKEQFGGNGRTCVTCHTAGTGTISPAQIQALYSANPDDPLFRPIDSDDGASDDYTQLRERATFRATIELPAGVFLTADPDATSIVLRRSVPSTINTPALDPVLMWDGRAPDLLEQALGAILGHAEATVTPTVTQLELIEQFEKGSDFFSSDSLREYSQGGSAPTWPPGATEAEQRGRRWFAEDAAAPRFNICGMCHGGPMTNETQANSGLPVGKHFQTVNVSEFNTRGNPTYEFTFPDPNRPGATVTVVTPDPGRALVTGDVRDLNFFKIPTLWGVKNTAPYFHDNSAATLEELMEHYEDHLATFLRPNLSYPRPHVPTAQDKADIIAYLKLL